MRATRAFGAVAVAGVLFASCDTATEPGGNPPPEPPLHGARIEIAADTLHFPSFGSFTRPKYEPPRLPVGRSGARTSNG